MSKFKEKKRSVNLESCQEKISKNVLFFFLKVLASSFSTISCFFQFKINDNQFIQEEWTLFSQPHVRDKKYWKGTD